MTATAEGSSDDGSADRSSGAVPSNAMPSNAMPFDAVANLRLLGEVQQRGLEAANLVIARLTERTNGPGDANPDQVDQMTAMADAFIQSFAAVAAAVTPGIERPRATGARPAESGAPEVLSARGAPGETVEVELWMHNYTDDLATGIELHLTELIDAQGARLPSSVVRLRPDRPFDLSAASSRSVGLVVDLPPDTTAGRYRGVVTAAHLADLWLVLELDVLAAAGSTAEPTAPGPADLDP